MTRSNVLTLILTCSTVLFLYLWLHKVPAPLPDERPLQDSLVKLSHINDSLLQSNLMFKASNDSLVKVKNKVLTRYQDKIVYIQTLDLNELDSVIITNIQ